MSFIFNLALRELRASWRRLLFFCLCIGIGVGSIGALRESVAIAAHHRASLQDHARPN